jgi:hypothetical protein
MSRSLPILRLVSRVVLSGLFLCSLPMTASSVGMSNPQEARRAVKLVVEPSILHFGNAVVGQTYSLPVTLTNAGHSMEVISDVYRSNGYFRMHAAKMPFRLNPGESVRFEIRFVPKRDRSVGTDFTFVGTGAMELVLHADGTGVSTGLTSNPLRVDFGNLPLGRRERFPVTLTNSGAVSQTIADAAVSNDEFGLWGLKLPITLDPGESVTFEARFEPHRIGPSTGGITLNTSGSNLAIAMEGEGSEVGQLSMTPTHLNFGNVTVGATATVTGRLLAGATDVTIYSAGITSPEFALSGISFPLTIPAGHSKSYQVTFNPSASGEASSVIAFQSSSAHLSTEQALIGTGMPRASHSVNLSWNSGSAGVVGYNVFRATSSSGPYSKINSAPDPNTSFLDTSVQGGQTYFYVTTAIGSDGKQSAFSNWIQVVIP